jgi:hypothetical protein
MGMGGQSPPQTFSQGGNPRAYIPTGQGQFDQNYQNLVQPMYDQSLAGLQGLGGITPAGMAWPQVQQTAQQFTNNPYAGTSQAGANTAGGYGPQFMGEGGGLAGLAGSGVQDIANTLILQGRDPLYQSLVNQAVSNPYSAQAVQGAQTAAGYGATGAAGAAGNAAALQAQVAPTLAAGGAVYNTAFDPQSSLYNRTAQQLTDQTRAALAASGMSSSPYAAGVEGQTLSNFGIDWQNQQLNRQLAGLKGLEGANTSAGLMADTGLGLSQGATSLANTSAGLPSQAYLSGLSSIVPFLNARNAADVQGAGAATNYMQGVGNIEGQGAGLVNSGFGLSQQPYQTSIGQGTNAFTGLGNLINYGNANYTIPGQTLNDIQSYMGLGQSASGISGQLGNLGAQQGLQQQLLANQNLGLGLGGVGQLAGLSGGLGSQVAGGTAAAEAAGFGSLPGDFVGTAAAFDALPTAAESLAAAPGAGSGILGALPFLAS